MVHNNGVNEVYEKHLFRKEPLGGEIMKTNAIKLNTGYFMPSNGRTISSFRGDGRTTTTTTLPAQGQDVVQIQGKTAASASENTGTGSKIHSFYNGLKHFFMDEPSFDPGFDDLDAIIFRSMAY